MQMVALPAIECLAFLVVIRAELGLAEAGCLADHSTGQKDSLVEPSRALIYLTIPSPSQFPSPDLRLACGLCFLSSK